MYDCLFVCVRSFVNGFLSSLYQCISISKRLRKENHPPIQYSNGQTGERAGMCALSILLL